MESNQGGNPNEQTAVVRRPEREPHETRIILGFVIACIVLVLGMLGYTCVSSKPRGNGGMTVKAFTAKTTADVVALQGRMALLEGRTGVVEVRTADLEKNARRDRETARMILTMAETLSERLDSKADKDELKKYARTRRVVKVERKLDDYIASVEEDDPEMVAAPDEGAGTITVKVVAVPVNPDEE